MVEAEVTSLISPWLTPTSLFILLNIVLAVILLLNNQHSKNNDTGSDNNGSEDGASLVPPPPQLTRAPSLFSRVASFNFSSYYSESHVSQHSDEVEHPRGVAVTRAPSLLYRVASFNFRNSRPAPDVSEGGKGNDVDEKTARDIDVTSQQHHVTDERTAERKKEAKVSNNNKKVNKKKKAVKKEVVEEVKEKKVETTSFVRGEDEQVDSKADDFINRFKQQLKMQRLDSLLRFRNNNDSNAAVAT